MIAGSTRRLESKSGIILILFLGVLVLALFFILWIQPKLASSENLDVRIAELQLEHEKQKRLTPVYLQLENRDFPEIAEILDVPDRGYLPEVEIASVIPFLRMLARDAGMSMQAVNPQLATLETSPGYLAVDMSITGNYLAFREFIFLLARLPYLGGIESISVTQVGTGADDKQVKMKLWLSIG